MVKQTDVHAASDRAPARATPAPGPLAELGLVADRSAQGAPMSQTEPVRASKPPPLAALAQRANDAHSAYQRGNGDALAQAIQAGTALLEAKQRIPFGEWLPWLAQHVQFAERTARLYMQVAADPASANWQRVADLSLRAAVKAITPPRRRARKPAAPAATGSELAAGESEPPQVAQADAARDSRLDRDRLSRVRAVLEAIDSLLARAHAGGQSDAAAVEMLREAAHAAQAVTTSSGRSSPSSRRPPARARPPARGEHA